MKRFNRIVPTVIFWIGVAGILLFFEWAVRPGILSPAVWAKPSEAIKGIFGLFYESNFQLDVQSTLTRTIVSLLVGYPLGVLIAVGLYCMGHARSSGELLLDFLRSVPLTALIPVFLVLFGPDEGSKLAIGTVSALLVTAITMWVGIREGIGRFHHMLHLYQPSLFKQLRFVILPHAGPSAVASLRLAVSAALVLVVVSEMFIGTNNGVGRVINDSQYTAFRGTQWGAVLFAGFLGYGLNRVADVLPLAVTWTRHRLHSRRGADAITIGSR